MKAAPFLPSFVLFTATSIVGFAKAPYTMNLPAHFSDPIASSFGDDRIFTATRPTDDTSVRTLIIVAFAPIAKDHANESLYLQLDHLLHSFARRVKDFRNDSTFPCQVDHHDALFAHWQGLSHGHSQKGTTVAFIDHGTVIYLTFQDPAASAATSEEEFKKSVASFTLNSDANHPSDQHP